MKAPIEYRRDIPLFYEKSESEYQKDPYEQFDNMVIRQSALHLADQLWGRYPMQQVMDFAKDFIVDTNPKTILELGCGVGRWIASLAQQFPKASCWGIDYSYQMLKRANEYWVQGQEIFVDYTNRGFPNRLEIKGHQLSNIQFGLAKAEDLPFNSNSQDLVLNSFLLDRLDDPKQGLLEMYRVLQPNATLILVSPLNFYKATHWNAFYPPIKIYHLLTQIGFSILDWKEAFFY